MQLEDFTFYFGAASGSSRKTLKLMNEPDVMISHHTKNNSPWPCNSLFIDSGGYSLMQKTGKHPPVNKYLTYVKNNSPELWAYQDYPCEPDILEDYNRTVEDHIEYTVERAHENRKVASEMEIGATPVVVLQGWKPNDYLHCLDLLKDRGLVKNDTYVGVGSVCGRNAQEDIKQIIEAISDELHDKNKIHAFGVKQDVLKYGELVNVLDSADSLSYDWDYSASFPGPRWHQVCYNYMEMKKRIARSMGIIETNTGKDRYTDNKEMYIETLNNICEFEDNSNGSITKAQLRQWASCLIKRHESIDN